jgi:hypothetical protein
MINGSSLTNFPLDENKLRTPDLTSEDHSKPDCIGNRLINSTWSITTQRKDSKARCTTQKLKPKTAIRDVSLSMTTPRTLLRIVATTSRIITFS